MYQKISEEHKLALQENREVINFVIHFYHKLKSDSCHYNEPMCSEIAVIFQSHDDVKDGGLKTLDYDSVHCDLTWYVLIWTCREPGWHISMPAGGEQKTNIWQNILRREYVSYTLMVWGFPPKGNFIPIFNAGKLTQQLIVDYYSHTEGDRLKFIHTQQANLRIETYAGLADALLVRADQGKLRVGQVILPSPFTGIPRNMIWNYKDAMAKKFGKPDLFLIFTCNFYFCG